MTGFEAISSQNGWIMAATGGLIVMAGLTVLATIISQLHKVIELFERKRDEENTRPITEEPRPRIHVDPLADLPSTAGFYRVLTAELGDSFLLADMFEVLKKEGNPHPHMTIKALREQGYLLPLGGGRFTWRSD